MHCLSLFQLGWGTIIQAATEQTLPSGLTWLGMVASGWPCHLPSLTVVFSTSPHTFHQFPMLGFMECTPTSDMALGPYPGWAWLM